MASTRPDPSLSRIPGPVVARWARNAFLAGLLAGIAAGAAALLT